MTQPEGFVEPGREDNLCLVLNALYGTKYAPYLFGEKLKKRVIEVRFKQLTVDICVYTQVNGTRIFNYRHVVTTTAFATNRKETI
jgi:hypothetical protein